MDKTELLEDLKARRKARGLSLEKLAELVGRGPVFVAAALNGQAQLKPDVAEAMAAALDVDVAALAPLLECPIRNSDPFKYRLHEMVDVYADALRDLTNEAFGDGILSAIDLAITFERRGERAFITLDSKFLPYKQF
jgi:cyanate lyase